MILLDAAKTIDNSVMIAIISACSVIGAAIVTGFFKVMELRINSKNKKTPPTTTDLIDISKNNLKIDKQLWDILNIFDAEKVTLSRFHNGGNFISGISMDKFTATNEVSKNTDLPSSMAQHKNILLSGMPDVMYELFFQDKFFTTDSEVIENTHLYNSVESAKIDNLYMFIIKNLSGNHEAFITIYNANAKITDNHFTAVWKRHNNILSLITKP